MNEKQANDIIKKIQKNFSKKAYNDVNDSLFVLTDDHTTALRIQTNFKTDFDVVGEVGDLSKPLDGFINNMKNNYVPSSYFMKKNIKKLYDTIRGIKLLTDSKLMIYEMKKDKDIIHSYDHVNSTDKFYKEFTKYRQEDDKEVLTGLTIDKVLKILQIAQDFDSININIIGEDVPILFRLDSYYIKIDIILAPRMITED